METIKRFFEKNKITEEQFYGAETVGGPLDLSSLTSLPEGFNPTVGGPLDLGSLTSKYTPLPKNYIFSWCEGKYIQCDGILSEVIIKKKGYYKIKIVGETIESFLAIEKGYSAHGVTLKQAVSDLKFKIISEKLKNEPIKKDTELTVKYYRLLTGACDQGVRKWLQQNNIPYEVIGDQTVEKEPMKAIDLLPLLEKTNTYGVEKLKTLLTF